MIAGAGPVGLLLAAELRLGGADVLVLEKLAAPSVEPRASTLHARTMELFALRGILARLGAPPPRELAGHFGGVPLDFSQLPTSYPGLWKVPQSRVAAILEEWARELGARVRREHEVVEIQTADDEVRALVRTPSGSTWLSASYLVGCDGEDSTVRRLAGFGFPGTAATRRMLRADVLGIDIPDRRFEQRPGGLVTAATRSGVTRVMVYEIGAQTAPRPGFHDVRDAWLRVTGEDIGAGKPIWVGVFENASQQADRYLNGRILLAGDAAHRQMPVGGQALNLGLQDAFNLGWKLAAQVAGRAPAGLLRSYHQERHPIGRDVLGNITAQSLLLLGGGEVEPLRVLLREQLELPAVRGHLLGMVSGLNVRYGTDADPVIGARLACDEVGPALPAGTRALPEPLEPLRRAHGVLLDFSADAARLEWLRSLVAPRKSQLDVAAAVATPGSVLAGRDALLVRPDGYVAWAGGGDAGLRAALDQWFGIEDSAIAGQMRGAARDAYGPR